MDTVVLKFGGSSVADNIRLNLVAEKIIELYKKALELRAEPNSNYSLAIIYKNRYDIAVKKKDAVKEVEYGKMVYEYLNKYVVLSGNKSAKYKKILNYFSSYK